MAHNLLSRRLELRDTIGRSVSQDVKDFLFFIAMGGRSLLSLVQAEEVAI